MPPILRDQTAPWPIMARIPQAQALSGLSRSALYRLAAERQVRFVKHGSNTMVDMASVRDFLASLPAAAIAAPRKQAA